MIFIDSKPSTVFNQTVGTGGIAKGEIGMLSSATLIDATAAAGDASLVGLAMADYAAGVVGQFELFSNRIVRSEYTGSATPSLGAVYDLSNGHTVNSDDTTDGVLFCTGFDAVRKTIDGFITLVHRLV